MSKKTETRRGRPTKNLLLPKGTGKFTVNDILAFNQAENNGMCRLSVYTKIAKLVKAKAIYDSGETQPTGGVGKPLTVYVTAAVWNRRNRRKAAKKAAKTRKLAAAAPVDMTPEPVAETPAEVPAEVPAEPATA